MREKKTNLSHPLYSRRKTARLIAIIGVLSLLLSITLACQNELFKKQTVQKIAVQPTTPSSIFRTVSVPTATPTEAEKQTLPTQWKTFTSSLGFSFDYPAEWGNVSERVIDASKEHSDLLGKRYELKFSSNERVKGSGQSPDFSQPTGSGDGFYKGDPDKPEQVYAVVFTWASYCPGYSASLYYAWINFNLPGKEISGVRLLLPLLSQNEIEKLEPITRSYNPLLPEEEQGYCQPPVPAEQFLNEIKDKQLDHESLRNVTIFKKVFESSRIEQ